MRRIAKFMKVSKEQFAEGWQDTFGEISGEELERIYESVKLPKRATSGSAGYDFFSPLTFELKPQETIKIPTGIRVQMEEGCEIIYEKIINNELLKPRMEVEEITRPMIEQKIR